MLQASFKHCLGNSSRFTMTDYGTRNDRIRSVRFGKERRFQPTGKPPLQPPPDGQNILQAMLQAFPQAILKQCLSYALHLHLHLHRYLYRNHHRKNSRLRLRRIQNANPPSSATPSSGFLLSTASPSAGTRRSTSSPRSGGRRRSYVSARGLRQTAETSQPSSLNSPRPSRTWPRTTST